MRSIVYRRSLSYTSGAGQLMAMQVRAMRAAGIDTQLACQRGALRFWLRARLRARRISAGELHRLAGTPELLVIDHGMELPQAQIVFAHNLMAEARRYLERPDIDAAALREGEFFSRLDRQALVVANSKLVRDAISRHYDWPDDQLRVCHPGFRADTFSRDRRGQLRAQARRALGIADATPLVGFVTSGDLHKRGLGVFIDTATAMLRERSDLRFLVTQPAAVDAAAHDADAQSAAASSARPASGAMDVCARRVSLSGALRRVRHGRHGGLRTRCPGHYVATRRCCRVSAGYLFAVAVRCARPGSAGASSADTAC
jgi:hypothetical protein